MLARVLSPLGRPKRINDYRKFTKPDIQRMLESAILGAINGIAQFKIHDTCPKKCFDISMLHTVKDVERDTPIEFQKQFFVFMDILAASEAYARLYIHNEHPDVEVLLSLLFRLYHSE